MKDKEIKKVFEQIKADESMKLRILENVYEESEKYKNNESTYVQITNFKYKKSLSVLAASLVLVCGVFLYNSNNEPDISSAPISMAPQAEPRVNQNLNNGEFKPEEIGVIGVVKDITVDGGVTSIIVEGQMENDTKYDIANIFIDKDTIIKNGDSDTLVNASDIKEGQKVEVVFRGIDEQSYPITGDAYSVKIINKNK